MDAVTSQQIEDFARQGEVVVRFPTLASHAHEVVGQVRNMRGNSGAEDELPRRWKPPREAGFRLGPNC